MTRPASTSSQDDLALAQRCAAGDRAAQRAFFQRQREQVHRTLFRVLGSNRDVEDLIQDTFIEVFGSLASFRGESSLNTWVDTIAARVVYKHLSRRASNVYPLPTTPERPDSSSDPEHAAAMRHAVSHLYALLDRLEPKHRIAYTLHVIDGRPIKEVARVMRCSVLAVKNRVWRARRSVHERAARDPTLREFIGSSRAAL